jgi:membrane dipeptidase
MTGPSGGVVRAARGQCDGAVSFLRPDGRQREETGRDPILRQMDYLMERLGEDHLGFGSDYDGCTTAR